MEYNSLDFSVWQNDSNFDRIFHGLIGIVLQEITHTNREVYLKQDPPKSGFLILKYLISLRNDRG